MLVTRRKRREDKRITLYLHYKPLEQVTQMKYLGIILDQKFRFQEHKICGGEMCKTYTYSVKSSKIVMGD